MLFQSRELEKMMHMAIINNRVSFVRLLLENGINLGDFLTAKRLFKLYNDVSLILLFVTYLRWYFSIHIGAVPKPAFNLCCFFVVSNSHSCTIYIFIRYSSKVTFFDPQLFLAITLEFHQDILRQKTKWRCSLVPYSIDFLTIGSAVVAQ